MVQTIDKADVQASEARAKKDGRAASKKMAPIIRKRLGIANITVVGVGGGGCNTVTRLMQQNAPGVNFVCINTDVKALQSSQRDGLIVLPIGEALTQGFGAGGKPEVGEQAALAGRAALRQVLSGSDIVFIATGLGGGTGTGAAPVVAEVAKKCGALVVAMVTLPFAWEGHKRLETALSGLNKLREHVDNMILVHNDRLSNLVRGDVPMQEAFKIADSAVAEGILVVAEIVNVPGEINVDLADIRAIMAMSGQALMAIGSGSGVNGAQQAAESAVKNPLLDTGIEGAKGVLFTVKGGPKLTLGQVNAAGRFISKAVDPDCTIFFGMHILQEMGDEVRLTLIATGIPDKPAKVAAPVPSGNGFSK